MADKREQSLQNGNKDEMPTTSVAMAKTTTISTIAVQSGKTRIVIALLHVGDWLSLKILEITPELTKLGATLEEAENLQRAHNEVLRQLQNKQSPVEELLRQADQLIATQKPRAEVYAAMAESLGRAWRDINLTLELRQVILDLNVQYHQKAKEFFEKQTALESYCNDSVVPIKIDEVKTLITNIHDLRRGVLETLMGALQSGNLLLAKLRELAAEGTLDSRPDRIRTSINRAISQVQGWLDELHLKRQILEVNFTKKKSQLEQCLALSLLAADLKELEDVLNQRREMLLNSSQLGDSSSSAELLLHEHKKLIPEAKQLQERALKLTKATEQLVTSGCFAGQDATTQAYVILSATTDYLDNLQHREVLLERAKAFFRLAQTVLAKLDQLEIQLKTTELTKSAPQLAQLHSQCASTIDEATSAPIAEGYAILDLVGHDKSGADGIKQMVEALENKKILLDGLCIAHREENIKINTALNNFLEQHNAIYHWLVSIAEAFLQGHQDMGSDLRMSEDFLDLHKQLLIDLQKKGNEINALLLTLPPIMEYLDDMQRKDVDSKVEAIHDRWMNLKNNLENRLDLAKIYVKFHYEANIVHNEMDKLEYVLAQNRNSIDEDTLGDIGEKFESLVPLYQSAKNTGLTFINEAKKATQPHLDANRARVCVESVLEKLAGRQLVVNRNWQTYREEVVVKRELLVRLEQTMAESTQTISWVSKLDSQLYPVITTNTTKPNEIAAFLENKLQHVLPDLKKAQNEVEQRIRSVDALVSKASGADDKTAAIKGRLSELHQKLIEITSEYQILLQVLVGYFKNIEEIDKKAETYSTQLENTGYSKKVTEVESVLRQHELTRETILERFRFAQTECNHISDRINKQEPPVAGTQDINKLQHVLELRRAEFENQWRQRHESLKSHYEFCSFEEILKQTHQNIDQIEQQIKNIPYSESTSAAKNAIQSLSSFEEHIHLVNESVKTTTKTGELLLLQSNPQSPYIQNEVSDLNDRWNKVNKQYQTTQELLDINIKYLEILDKINDWNRDGNKLLVTVARKSTAIKHPEEAKQVLNEISKFLYPGAEIQRDHIQKLSELSFKLHGSNQNKMTGIVSANKELLESFSAVSKELEDLGENLIAAEAEKQRQLLEQERLRAAEEARKLEELRLDEERKRAEEARLAAEQAKLNEERRLLAEAQRAEHLRLEEEKRKLEQARIAEENRLAEERRRAEELLRADQARLAEERRRHEEQRLADEKRIAEEARLAEERKRAEEIKIAEEAWKTEQVRLEHERQKIEQTKIEEEQRRTEKARLAAEEARLQHERRKLEEARINEDLRLAGEKRKLELIMMEEARKSENVRLEAEQKKAEILHLEELKHAEQAELAQQREAEEARLKYERQKLHEAQLEAARQESERHRAEQIKLEELRKAEQMKLEELRKSELARLEEERQRAEKFRHDEQLKLEETRKAEHIRIEELRRSEQVKLEKQREDELARLDEMRKAEEKRLEDARRATQARLEEERRVIEEIRKHQSVEITEIKHINKIESIQREKSPIIEEAQEAPIFTSPLSDEVIQEGSKFTFICKVTGTPNPDVTWYKSGVAIQNNPDYHTTYDNGLCKLTIEETFAEDSSKYTCVATNPAGTAETSALLSVKESEPEEQLQPPSFRKMLQPAVAKENQAFQFECTVEGNPLPNVQWFKNGECIDNSANYLITYNNGEAILKFEKVNLDDKGVYTCKAANEMGTAQSTANLIVTPLEPTEAPNFITPLSNIMARAGQKLKLECEVSGLPHPILTWSHNGRPVKETRDQKLIFEGNKATLVINEAFPKDAGTYQVIAKNIAGQASSSCTVSVKGRLPTETSDSEMASDMEPIRPSVQLPLTNTSAKEADRIRLDCVIVGQPEPEVIWYHDDKPVKESADIQLLFQGDRCSLVIQEALPEDAGEYKVVALNSAGEASSKCQLTVSAAGEGKPKEEQQPVETKAGVAPKFVKLLTDVLVSEGDKVVLEGNVIGDPRPEIKWLLNNLLVADKEHYLTTYDNEGNFKLEINNVLPEDKGVYTVKASNTLGDAKCFAQLIVKSFKPAETVKHEEVKSAPEFKELFRDKVAFEDSGTKFECMVLGKPKPKVKWLFNGNPIAGKDFLISTSGNREVLSIPVLKKEHQGTITCVAENEAGKASCAATLTVQSQSNVIALPEMPPTGPLNKAVTQHVESSYKLSREVVTETSASSSSKMITTIAGSGEPHIEEHKFVSQQAKQFSQINQQPPDIKESHKTEEYHKIGKQPPIISEKITSTVTIGDQSASQTKSIEHQQQQLYKKPVKIARPPKFITPVIGKIIDQNVDVTLEGILDGQPSPSVTWTKNGEEIKSDNRISISWNLNKASLQIKDATVSDAGRYSCTAVNEAGTAVSTADLVVRKTIFPPVFGRRLQAQVVKKGDRIIMEVEITGTPEPTVTWYKDGISIKDAIKDNYKIKSMGQSHTLTIEKGNLNHGGRYMVRATNAGGEAQSIADIAVYEPTPDTMVEVVKTVVFEDIKKHETLSSASDKTSSTMLTPKPVELREPQKITQPPQNLSSYTTSSQSMSSKMEFTSKSEQQSFESSKSSDVAITKPEHIIEKHTDFQICYPPEINKQEVLEEKKTETTESGIETSSISKQSSLQYFVKKMSGSDTVVQKEITSAPEPIKREIYEKFSTDAKSSVPIKIEEEPIKVLVPLTPPLMHKPVFEYKSYSQKVSTPIAQEYKSFSSNKEEKKEIISDQKIESSSFSSTSKIISEPIVQEYKSFSSTVEHVSEPLKKDYKPFAGASPKSFEYKTFASKTQTGPQQEFRSTTTTKESTSVPFQKKFDLKPEPPAEICYTPKTPATVSNREETFEKFKKIAEAHSEIPEHQIPKGGIKIIPSQPQPKVEDKVTEHKEFSEKIEKSYQMSSFQSSSSSYSHTVKESSTTPTQKSWTTKHEVIERPASVASSAYSSERHIYNRPLSVQSGLIEPSQEGIQMEKQWAHKFSETSHEVKPTWSVQSTLEKKWTPSSQKHEQLYKETTKSTVTEQTPFPVPHYIAEVSHLGSKINEQKLESSYSTSKTESSIEQRHVKPSIKSWPPTPEYKAPLPKPFTPLETLRPVSVQDITDEVYLEPGPPPEIAFAAPPRERRQSHVEQVEQVLEKDLEREPTKVLPCAVRTIPPPKYILKEAVPPPLPPKKEFPQAPPIPAKKAKVPVVESPFERFPELEPFPFKPVPEKPKPARVGPPPTPSKFIKGKFTDSDYESDFESVRIPAKWKPAMSDTEEPAYRRVRPPQLIATGRSKSQEPQPLPPSRFDQPPQFSGPPRPEINFEEFRRKKDASQIKKITKHYEAMRREVSPPKIKPASPPIYVQPEKQPESPKVKKRVFIDGYMADTDEPFTQQQKFMKTEYSSKEEKSHFSQSSHYESTTSSSSMVKQRVSKFPVKKQQFSTSTSMKKELVATPIISSQTTKSVYEEQQKDTKIQSFPKTTVRGPPPPSPSKFVKGEFKESDYESDYESRIQPIWGAQRETHYKPVRPLLTPSQQHHEVDGRTPTPPTEFDNPPHIGGPPRPKFEPIEKIKPGLKNAVYKPKPKPAVVPVSDVVVATTALPRPGSPPEIGFAPGPKKTQYYKSVVSTPYHNAVQTETSNIVHLDESTDTCHRTMSVQQTHKVIQFGDQYKKTEKKLEPFPYQAEHTPVRRPTSVPPPPTPTKFIPGEFRESDYESEVESCKIKPKWIPRGEKEGELHYRKVRPPSLHQRSSSLPSRQEYVPPPSEISQPPLMPENTVQYSTTSQQYLNGESRRHESTMYKKTSDNQIMKRSHSFEPPVQKEYGYKDERITRSTATKMASHHMDSMTKDFKSKTQQFVKDIMTDVSKKQEQKPILKSTNDEGAQVYREESRAMQHGTKHVDPDTGLIYFKYDFGYEFGIILPGESKSGEIPVPKKTIIEPPKRTRDIEMPVYHESSTISQAPPTPQFKPKKFTSSAPNKWEPTSESEMSEYEGESKRRNYHQRWEPSSCSPMSLSPSLPSTSPAFNVTFAQGRNDTQTPPSCPSTPGVKMMVTGQPRAPMFITPLRDIAVVSSQPAKFECIVQSEPPPNILWSKNGRIIENSNDYQLHYRNGVSRLTISQAYPEDAGTYTCTATNSVGTTNTSATLQVPGERRSQYLK